MKNTNKKFLVVTVIALILAIACMVGTLALLMRKTQTITNTFTVGNVEISLTESENLNLKMVPGQDITKDPKITVTADSENCWVFVKIVETNNTASADKSYISYTVADGWTQLNDGENDVAGVYYRSFTTPTGDDAADAVYKILAGDKVTVNSELTVDDMTAASADGKAPTLSFTGYAVQSDTTIDTAIKAWAEASKLG